MTPKQRMVAALRLEQPDDIVPTFELLGAGLSEDLTGKSFIPLGELSGRELDAGVKENAALHVEIAEGLDYSAIAVGDIREIKELVRMGVNDTYLLTLKNGDGTWRFWQNMLNVEEYEAEIVRMYEDPDGFKRDLDAAVTAAIEHTKPLIDAGIEAVLMGADYAITQGPFLSPDMFAEFITPYLARSVEGHRANGAYVLKHTDGNIMPILNQIIDCGPDALVAIDPTAGMDIAEVKRLVGDRICLVGNVDVAALMEGDRDKIRASALYCLKHAKPGGGYIYQSANSVYPPVKLEDYLYMMDLRKQFGRYDREVEIPL